jgi:hypothetical protein
MNYSNKFEKTEYQIKIETDTINRNISRLTPVIIDTIRREAGLDETYVPEVFRPNINHAMLLFKKDKTSKYTINLRTLNPTSNSSIKYMLSDDIKKLLTY